MYLLVTIRNVGFILFIEATSWAVDIYESKP